MRLVPREPTKGYLDNWLWVPKAGLNTGGLKNALQFEFADYSSSEEKTRLVTLWRETKHHMLVPREFWKPGDLPVPVIDCRPTSYPSANIKSHIKLDHLPDANGVLQPTGSDVQQKSMDALLRNSGGILQLACGKGKTVVFLELAARLKTPTLMIVPDTNLMEQWEQEATALLEVPEGIGRIQAEVFDWKKPFVLATYHTIANLADNFPEELRRWFGLVGWDEGHHISAPTFAKSADLFYGKRIALTATPVRDDGTHIIYNFHIGRVIYKDLSQDIKPRVVFKWTGLQVPKNDLKKVKSKNGEIHLSKLTTYFSSWNERLEMIIDDVTEAVNKNRKKILVLSNSVAEIVNLLAIWTRGKGTYLYTDIPEPTLQDIEETAQPSKMESEDVMNTKAALNSMKEQLESASVNPALIPELEKNISICEQRLEMDRVARKLEGEMRKRQRAYVKDLEAELTTGGLMTFGIKAKVRNKYAKDKQVVFAIMKYGKEGLNAPDLDTVFVCELFSQRNGLQQLMGRTTRDTPGKVQPVVVFYEDDVGVVYGMSKKLTGHLLAWPHEDGGPFSYELLGHPRARSQWNQRKSMSVFGP
jgi:superfamily II DNA or RNA helicase